MRIGPKRHLPGFGEVVQGLVDVASLRVHLAQEHMHVRGEAVELAARLPGPLCCLKEHLLSHLQPTFRPFQAILGYF